jgi:hypothetical protein
VVLTVLTSAGDRELFFEEPEIAMPLAVEPLPAEPNGRLVRRDIATGRTELVVREDWGSPGRLPDGLVMADQSADTFEIVESDPLSARAASQWTLVRERGDWRIRIETRSVMTSDRDTFRVTNAIDAYEGSVRQRARLDGVHPKGPRVARTGGWLAHTLAHGREKTCKSTRL